MAEIQIRTILDTSSFDAGVKTVQAKITELENKPVNIRFTKTSSSTIANNLKKEAAESATAMQRQINAITGVDRSFKSAADSANYFKLSGRTAYEQVGAQAEALARTQAEMASSGTTAMQRQINALTGVDREFKSAADSASFFRESGLTAFEQQSAKIEKFNQKLSRMGTIIKRLSFFALVKGIKDALSEMKAVDAELINTSKVLGATDEQMKALEQGAYRLAEAYGHTASEVMTAETAFARAGYGDKIEQMAELNLLTQNAGDLTSEEASSFLLAADAAFGYEGNIQKLMAVLDGMDNVSNKNATDMQKLAEGLTVAGSVFASAGESAQTFTAMLGTATAATQRSGSEMARGLRTIFMNIRQIKGETEDGELIDGESIANAAKALREFAGVSTMENGELRKGSEVLAELAGKWDTLNQVQKSAIAQNVAGVRQANILLALMDNWDMYEKMLVEYADAAGTAMQENERYLDGWQAKTDKLSAAWTKFVANTISSDFIKGLLDISTKFLNVSGSIGTVTAAMGGLIVAFKGAKIVDTVKTAFVGFGASLKSATGGFSFLTSAIGAFITVMAIAVQRHANWRAEMVSNSAEALKQAEETISKQEQLNDLIAQYRELAGDNGIGTDTAKQEQARAIQEQIVALVGDQATGIDLVNGALETQLGILQNISSAYTEMSFNDLKAGAIESEKAIISLMNDRLSNIASDVSYRQEIADIFSKYSYLNYYKDNDSGRLNFKGIENLSEATVAIQQLTDARNELLDNGMATGKTADFFSGINKSLAEYLTVLSDSQQATEAFYQSWISMNASGMEGGLTPENIESAAYALVKENNLTKEQADLMYQARDSLVGYNTSNKETASGAGETSDALEIEAESAKSLQEETAKYQKQLEVLKKAQQEENETGMITADTFEEIKDAGVEVGDYYVDELTGNIKMAEGATQDLIDTAQEWLDDYAGRDPMDAWEQGLERAQNALARFKKELQDTGERGDTLEELQKEYGVGQEFYNNQQYGSREYQGFLEMFISEDKKRELGYNFQKIGEFAYTGFVGGLMKESTVSDKMEYLAKNFEDNFGGMEEAGASFITNTDGSISMLVSNMDKLVEKTGISADFWYMLGDALDIYSTDRIQQENQKAVESVQDLNTATEETETDKTVEIDASEAVTATGQFEDLSAAIARVPRAIDIKVGVSGTTRLTGDKAGRLDWSPFAEGTENAPGGLALVNEIGPEIISQNGRAFIANGGEPALVQLQPGAVVLNHIRTEKALNGAGNFGEISAYALGTKRTDRVYERDDGKGNVKLPPTAVKKGPVPSSNNQNKKNTGRGTASSTTEEDKDDPWKIVQDYYNYANDLADRAKDHLDYLVDKIQNEWDDLKEPLDDQIDALERVNDQLDRQATLLERERDKLTKPLQDQIDAMNDAKDIQDEQLELAEKQKAVEEARAELQNAQNERTIRYFNTEKGQWEWMADKKRVQDAQDAIASAEKDLVDYQYELEIRALERQISGIEDDYQKKLDAIEEQQTANEDRIYDLEQQLQDMEDYYKAQMKPLEKQIETMERQMADYAELWAQIAITQDLPEGDLNAAINRLGNLTPEQKQSIRDIIEGVKGVPNGSGAAGGSSGGEVASAILPGKGTWESALSEVGAMVDGKSVHVYGDGATVYNTVTNNDSHNVSYTIGSVTVQGDPSKMTVAQLLESTGIYAGN